MDAVVEDSPNLFTVHSSQCHLALVRVERTGVLNGAQVQKTDFFTRYKKFIRVDIVAADEQGFGKWAGAGRATAGTFHLLQPPSRVRCPSRVSMGAAVRDSCMVA